MPARLPSRCPASIPPLLLAAALLSAPVCWPDAAHADEAGAAAVDGAASLTEADEAFNRAAFERKREDVSKWLADDAVFFSDVPNQGRDAFLNVWAPLWEGKYEFSYKANSKLTVVAESGELGYTLGEAETSFQHPANPERTVNTGHYLNIWQRSGEAWRLRASAPLVVHAEWGMARETRSGLMTAWPELRESVDARFDIDWRPEEVLRAASDEVTVTFGSYEVVIEKGDDRKTGNGRFVTVWERNDKGQWQLAGEGMTPPAIH